MFTRSHRQRFEVERAAELAASIMSELGHIPGPERPLSGRSQIRQRCAVLGGYMRRLLSRDADAGVFKPFGSRPLTHGDLFVFAARALAHCERRRQ